jgi:hypothetical protein
VKKNAQINAIKKKLKNKNAKMGNWCVESTWKNKGRGEEIDNY